MKRIIYITAIFLLFCSCSFEENEIIPNGNNREKFIAEMSLFSSVSDLQTKSDETSIQDVVLFVFENNQYKYITSGKKLSTQNNKTSFQAILYETTTPSEIVLIANAEEEIEQLNFNLNISKNELVALLTKTYPAAGIYTHFPMWGEMSLPDGITQSAIESQQSIEVLRAIARVDIHTTDVAQTFTLQTVQAFRVSQTIQMIPTPANVTQGKVTAPSVPSNSLTNTNAKTVNQAHTATLYLPESIGFPVTQEAYVTEASCIVIGGEYNNNTRYYRLNLGKEQIGQILRNYHYQIRVKKIYGPGYPTPEAASLSADAFMEVELIEWEEYETYVEWSGRFFLGVSTRHLQLKGNSGTSDNIQLTTNIDDYSLYWVNSQGEEAGEITTISNDAHFSVTFDRHANQIHIETRNNYPSGGPNPESKIRIKTSRITVDVLLEQLPEESGGGNTEKGYIRVLSWNLSEGSLGNNSGNVDVLSQGLSHILKNTSNFGPNGTVKTKGFLFYGSNSQSHLQKKEDLEPYDVIFLNPAGTQLDDKYSTMIYDWLTLYPNKVLFVGYYGSINQNEMLGKLGIVNGVNIDWNYALPNILYYYLNSNADLSYFTNDGPFSSGSPIGASFKFRRYDNSAGIKLSYSTITSNPITPLLLREKKNASTDILLGIDFNRNVVYCGDIGIFALGSNGSTNGEYLTSTNGSINNDAAKLVANLWAWIVGRVYGEH
ncbi:hypothetical protein [Parabacteroides sp. PF5-9]|uniref:hypothetical protein n=1 Tax=Parabacteroides sp. PF5-9 TaxID=1742404 RepID=UPI002475C0AF|nr:hypothetical protein [Parabacteroides sp. PF5-9]MDH6357688.1 hypothetical protein [Parabacteroides sp. PF5-9]